MFNVGPLELIVVLIIALIVLGPTRLPDVARSVGRGMREFRTALEGPEDDDDAAEVDFIKHDDEEPEAEAEAAAATTGEGYQKDADSSESSSSSSERV